MPLFPKIAGPCPYLDRFDSIMDGEYCRMCKRQVHDLTDMTDAQRAQFMVDCGGDACVSYTVWMRPALAAAALAASGGAMVAFGAGLDQTNRPKPVHLAGMIVPPPQFVGVRTAGEPQLPRASKHKGHKPRPARVVHVPTMVPMVTAGIVAPPPPAPEKSTTD